MVQFMVQEVIGGERGTEEDACILKTMPMTKDARQIPYRSGALLLLLLAAAVVMAVNASRQELVLDELLGYYTIAQPTAAVMLRMQLTLPVVIEPPVYDLMVHGAWKVFGSSALALRLPSILCMVLLMASVYALLGRLHGTRTAFFTTLLVFFLPFFVYGWQARPYCFMLAMTALAILCWYDATHDEQHRAWAIAGLFLSLALAINGHFFSIFGVLPLLVAEAVRSATRRRLDWPVVGALLLACSTFALTLPFRAAAAPYVNHTITGDVNWMQIIRTYEWTLNFNSLLSRTHHGFGIYTVALVSLTVGGSAWRLLPRGEGALWTLIAGILLVPFVTVAFAVFLLHAYYPRYGLVYNVGLMLCLGVSIGPWLNRMSRSFYVGLVVCFCVVCAAHQRNLARQVQLDKRNFLAGVAAPDSVVALLRAQPALLIYAPIDACVDEAYYGSPLLKERLRCVYSKEREMRYGHTVQVALTSQVLSTEEPFHVVTYEQMMAAPGDRLIVETPQVWERWLMASLQADGVRLKPQGNGVTGKIWLAQ
jgi:4-amino-4-deoxy-L-arabinose transferase-like glycosyltransferase